MRRLGISCSLFLLLLIVACSPAVGRFKNLGYAEATELSKMHEPSLSARSAVGTAAFRFTWSRSFDNPIAIRLYDDGQGKHIVFKRLAGQPGDKNCHLQETIERDVSDDQWAAFLAMFKELEFANMRSFPESDVIATDGAEWCLEAYYGGKYHFVSRWSPETAYDYDATINYPDGTTKTEMVHKTREACLDKFRAVCLFLLSLSGVSIPEDRIY